MYILLVIGKHALYIFDLVNDIRLAVIVNYFLAVSWFLYSLKVGVVVSVEYAAAAASMAGFAYLLNRYTDYHYDLIVDRGLGKMPRNAYLILAAVFLGIGIASVYGSAYHLIPILVGMVFGTIYSVKTLFALPLKNYFLIKNIIATGAKYTVSVGGALALSPVPISGILIASISMFCFYLIYELLWDIRDVESDRFGNVVTVPIVMGTWRTLQYCFFLWLSGFATLLFLVNYTPYFFIKFAVVLFFIVSLLRVQNVRWFHIMTYTHLVLNFTFVNHEVIKYLQSIFW
jgi:4-hydroxybenzoate polyprenyltransferase